jgi:cysteine desulfurase
LAACKRDLTGKVRVGTIYPVEKIGAIAQKYHIPFLCDASQAVGKM